MNRLVIRWLAFLFLYSSSLVGQNGWRSIGDASSVTVLPQGVELTTSTGRLRVTALSPNVIRVRNAQGETFPPEHSFAALPNAFPTAPDVHVEQSADSITVTTNALRVQIRKTPLQISFLDTNGKVVSQDQPGYPVSFDGTAFHVWKSMPEDEHYFGLGDKSGPLDHRNLSFTMWNTDAFGWQESTDPLYKDIPFLLAMRNGSAYGIFLDNTYRTNFDFGKESRDFYSFGADGGELDYYFFYGPDPKRVIQDFTALVGRSQLPPLVALGYQQCRYSYYPEARVREIAREFRTRKIPADIIYLDIDYQQNNRPFTIDREKFPNFEGMVKDLKTDGFKIIAITDLHIAKHPGYKPYDEGISKGFFVTNPDGSTYVGKVWPGDSVFPDFTRDAVRKWWGTLYTDFVHTGIRGFWNDMNEPSVFERTDKTMPLDTVHNVEGRKTDHREIHNVFGMENVHATYEGLLKLQPDVRPFVLTRAAYAGAQRYAATWTGDNSATWNHMRISIPQLLNLGLSGYSFVGDDIGGFAGSPTPELLTRWMELGVFNPIYRNHATKGSRDREPWVDGPEHEAIRRRYIETRYKLLPYIYTGMEEASKTGIPFMRPMFLEFPGNSNVATNDGEFMFGPNLLVAPKLVEFVGPYEVQLPGGNWYDFWSGQPVEGESKMVDPPLETLPVYVRAGSILPQQPIVQNLDETPSGPLQISVYPGPDCRGSLYQDDGNSFAYTRGDFYRVQFTCDSRSDALQLNLSSPQGTFNPWWKQLKFVFFGTNNAPRSITVNHKQISDWNFDVEKKTVTMTLSSSRNAVEIQIQK
ncbi:MAG TPA: glycoside hydrolase family 31 protein [Terriglobales bacterium]